VCQRRRNAHAPAWLMVPLIGVEFGMKREKIRELAKSIVLSKPGGIRYGALVGEISQQAPETTKKDIQWSIWDLDRRFPKEISKPTRGLFVAAGQTENEAGGSTEQVAPAGSTIKEADFYEPFADWLKNDLEFCTFGIFPSLALMGFPNIYQLRADQQLRCGQGWGHRD
jgi:hypothetical protein